MLKITRLTQQGLMKLEGELLEPWVGTVRDACSKESPQSQRPRLDLAAVRYVDAAGAQILRDLINEGAEVVACSTFLGALLRLEIPHGGLGTVPQGPSPLHPGERTLTPTPLPGLPGGGDPYGTASQRETGR